MFNTVKHRVIAVFILIALIVIFVPMWLYDASRLKIHLWSLPSVPSAPAVEQVNQLPAVEILDSRAEKNNPDAWALELGSFSDPTLAQQLIAKIRAKDLPAYAETITTPQSSLTTVYAGPELTQEDLQKLEKSLDENFKIKGSVVVFTSYTG